MEEGTREEEKDRSRRRDQERQSVGTMKVEQGQENIENEVEKGEVVVVSRNLIVGIMFTNT